MLLFFLSAGSGMAYALPVENAVSVNSVRQNGTCTGVVKDATGETVIGASVVVKGTTNGVVTGIDGDFSLSNVKKGDVIVISFVGYITQEVKWNGQPLNILLAEDTQTLDEVVVVAFGTQKKVNVTGAVSSVGAKEIAARPVNSTVEALQGIIPGMNISTSSDGGSLKGSKNFNIRGTGTIGKGSSVSPLVLIDGMEGDMNALNPQDIENISVLKDAAASSIYGSRAPGGVILITTKNGKSGKTSVNYNNSFRFNSPLNMPHMADSYSFALAVNDQLGNGGQSAMYSPTKLQQIKDYQAGKATQFMWPTSAGRWNSFDDPSRQDVMPAGNSDWLHELFGNSFTQEHSISANGGTETIQYYVSANYLNQGGLLKYGNDGKQRYSFTGKLNAQLSKWLKMNYSIRFNRTDYDSPSFASAGENKENVFYFDVCRYWPVIPVIDPNGFYTAESKIYQLTEGGRYKTQNDVIAQQLQFVLEPIKNWKTTVELNYRSNYNFEHTDYQTVYAYDVNKNPYVIANSTSGVSENAYKSNFFNPNIFSEYSFELEGGHNFKVMAGFQSELFKQRNVKGSQDNIMAGIPTLNTTSNNAKASGGYQEWATAGFFGRMNYDYKGRYLLEANLRYDGTSRFLKDKRWNWFPSFSAGWNIARENFFEGLTDKINTLKIRGSWGELGNQNTDNWYPFYRTIDYKPNDGGWLINGAKPNTAAESGLVSALLGWEKTQTLDLGLDLGLLNNRLNLSFDYFQRKSKDMVGPGEELPAILGASVPNINNLDMTSKGWELQVSWRDQINEFRYGATFTLSDSKVVIDKYPNPSKDLGQTYYDGAVLGDIWGYQTIGIAKTDAEMQAHLAKVDQSALGSNWGAGDIMYADLDGDKTISAKANTADNHGDKIKIGNNTPRYNFGLNLDGAYKGFDFKIFLQGTLKRDYMPSDGSTMFWGAVGYWQTNFFEYHLDYFRPEGTNSGLGANVNAYFPRPLENGRNRQAQTGYLQNAAYCRLKNVTLGYTLPAELTRKWSINNVRLFVSAENLLTITSLADTFDPETVGVGNWDGCTYPLSKTISFGLNVTF
ncbi:MAG: TonB-dependent receptor [Bacteroides helcogenes]|nr:TonB-dependent receptor [Bacteroides helcogenes]MDY5237680.1 TonB-dependent receptor [Bacteroides helcogenes]